MKNETSIEMFIEAIQKLPNDEYKKKWIRWLSDYDKPGPFDRKAGEKHSAKFAYNHIAYPEMLLWLIEAAGVEKRLVKAAEADSNRVDSMNAKCGVIRKHVPWEVLELALQNGPSRMPTQWLQYWKPFQLKDAIAQPWLLNHSAGDQLARVNPGDTVWIISVEPPGRLITLGPIHVERIVGQDEAENCLGAALWAAKHHIIDTSKDVYRAKRADLSSVASRLRFASKKFPRLLLTKGEVSGKQFQQMRKLEPDSAALISREWHKVKSHADEIIENYVEVLKPLKSLDEKRLTLVRREQKLLRQMLYGTNQVGQCSICGSEYPVALLIAAHIKPRAKCTDAERRDIYNNLMPLCSLGCDSLFEQGYISVDKGLVLHGPRKAETQDLKAQVELLVGSECLKWSLQSKKYFDWRANSPILAQ